MAGGAVVLSAPGSTRADLYKGGLNVYVILVAILVSEGAGRAVQGLSCRG